MKKIIAGTGIGLLGILLAGVGAPALVITNSGCSTLSSHSTNAPSSQTIAATVVVLQGAARDGAIIAMQNDPSTRAYFQLAAAALGTFATGTNSSPATFQQALTGLNVPQLTNAWVQIGIGTVIDLYQLYYGQYVATQLGGNATALAFITAVQSGLNAALGTSLAMPLGVPHGPAGMRPAMGGPAPTGGGGLLPRPISPHK